jgi:hypothetical protein
LLHLVGCIHYLYQCCTVKQTSDNEIYLLIKYIKSVLWRAAKRLSYTEDARCLKVNVNFLPSFSCQYYRLVCALFNNGRSGYRLTQSVEKLDDAWAINWKGEGSRPLPANFRCYSSTSWKDYDKHNSGVDFNPGPRKQDSSITQKAALSITGMHRLST